MGTWGEGLFDNDTALDVLADFVERVSLNESPAHFAAGLGLRMWILPSSLQVDAEETRRIIDSHQYWIDAYPVPVRELLARVRADPVAMTERRHRSDGLREIIGDYSDGPLEPALFSVEGTTGVLGELRDACVRHLDDLTAQADLYELAGDLAPLGILLELSTIGLLPRVGQVARWKRTFDLVDAETRDDRDFWDGYARNVRAGFKLLRTRIERGAR
jgi:hypothetical protein